MILRRVNCLASHDGCALTAVMTCGCDASSGLLDMPVLEWQLRLTWKRVVFLDYVAMVKSPVLLEVALCG